MTRFALASIKCDYSLLSPDRRSTTDRWSATLIAPAPVLFVSFRLVFYFGRFIFSLLRFYRVFWCEVFVGCGGIAESLGSLGRERSAWWSLWQNRVGMIRSELRFSTALGLDLCVSTDWLSGLARTLVRLQRFGLGSALSAWFSKSWSLSFLFVWSWLVVVVRVLSSLESVPP